METQHFLLTITLDASALPCPEKEEHPAAHSKTAAVTKYIGGRKSGGLQEMVRQGIVVNLSCPLSYGQLRLTTIL